jgi:RimJ/RimL family protein N-acetyltransferase
MDPLLLSDSVIFLRPLQIPDGPAHLAGEDEEIAAYLSGGKSSEDTVRAYIERSLEDWRSNGPRRTFGVFSCANASLVGSVEANLSLPALKPGQANISYGVFSEWRGQGIAVRAVRLVCEYLRTATKAHEAIIRTVPSNEASAKVAVKAGFHFKAPHQDSVDTPMLTYSLDLRDR